VASLSSKNLIWVNTGNPDVGAGGGGVATAIYLLQQEADTRSLKFEKVNFFGKNWFGSVVLTLRLIFRQHAKFIFHSVFNFPFFFCFLFGRSDQILLFTHGEFLNEALAHSRFKKSAFVAFIRCLRYFFPLKRRIEIYCSNMEEAFNFNRCIGCEANPNIIPDFFDFNALPNIPCLYEKDLSVINVFMICRMVANKRIELIFDFCLEYKR